MTRMPSRRTMPASRFSVMSLKSSLAGCSGRPSPCIPRWVEVPASPTSQLQAEEVAQFLPSVGMLLGLNFFAGRRKAHPEIFTFS